MNRFDQLKARCFTIVTGHMGYVGSWLSSLDDQLYPASLGVNFKTPTLKEVQLLESQEFTWRNEDTILEYMAPDFPGLYELVIEGSENEIVNVTKNDVSQAWRVLQVLRMYDGDTYWAKIVPITVS